MNLKHSISVLVILIALSIQPSLYCLDNLTRNDPYPLFSSVYPYSFLSKRQREYIRHFEYVYPVDKFRVSVSGFRQSANRARNNERQVVQIGDINGRWNVLSLFYDKPLRNELFNVLKLGFAFDPCNTPTGLRPCGSTRPPIDDLICPCDPELGIANTCECLYLITDPHKVDPNKEFGFFSIPIDYRKYGVRVESEVLLIDRCWYAVGLLIQFGIADVRQTVRAFNDLTCQALGIACPVFDCCKQNSITSAGCPGASTAASNVVTSIPDQTRSCGSCGGSATAPTPAENIPTNGETCPAPNPQPPFAVTPPFLTQAELNTPPACPPSPYLSECAIQKQNFQPCCNDTCCFSFNCDCKRLVIERIMKEKFTIADVLGVDLGNYHKIGIEDLRIQLYWRHLYVVNEESDVYHRLIFMPFGMIGVGIPMEKAAPPYKPFAVPIGNNGHTSIGAIGGFTLDFPDSIEFAATAGITHFFSHEFSNVRLPTNVYEGAIFPYKADIKREPGLTWHVSIAMNSYRFLENLSVWAEYMIESHAQDKIHVCRSFIPSTSKYFKKGFIDEYTETLTKWEVHLFNFGFNYDLSANLSIGFFWQAPVKQRNAYRSTTVMGTISFVY